MIWLNVLECSSKGDKRFSAFYAYVEVYGRNTNIERHYQSSKKFYDANIKKAKGLQPDYMEINEKQIDTKYLTAWYKLLWLKYLDQNPILVKYASEFDEFNDVFKSKKSINCQADVIRQYIKEGRQSIIQEPDVIALLKILRS